MSQVAARSAAEAMLAGSSDQSAHDWLVALEEVPLFTGLSKRHLRRVAKLAHVRRFASGATLVRAGDSGRSFFVLLDGTAKVVRSGGRPRRLGMGDYFGEMALLDGAQRSADVVAETDVLALTVDRSGFTKLLSAEPTLAHALLRTLATRLRTAETSV
jgi:CRP/FNR family cyclic AMP-dependent transcriptional regulator